MLAMDVWCFSKSTIRVDLEKHQTRLHYWGNSLCNFEESPLQLWVFLLCTKHSDSAWPELWRSTILQTVGGGFHSLEQLDAYLYEKGKKLIFLVDGLEDLVTRELFPLILLSL